MLWISFISSRLYKSFAFETLNRTPHLSGPRRYFFHHSYRVLSLQCYPSLAGKTGGTRIDKYRTLIMPLVRKCKEQHALAHLYKPSCSALILLAAVAARVPSLKLHIPLISTLRIGFRYGRGCPTQSKVPSRQSCEIAA